MKQAIKPWKNVLVENLFLNVHFLYAQYGITNNTLIKKECYQTCIYDTSKFPCLCLLLNIKYHSVLYWHYLETLLHKCGTPLTSPKSSPSNEWLSAQQFVLIHWTSHSGINIHFQKNLFSPSISAEEVEFASNSVKYNLNFLNNRRNRYSCIKDFGHSLASSMNSILSKIAKPVLYYIKLNLNKRAANLTASANWTSKPKKEALRE